MVLSTLEEQVAVGFTIMWTIVELVFECHRACALGLSQSVKLKN